MRTWIKSAFIATTAALLAITSVDVAAQDEAAESHVLRLATVAPPGTPWAEQLSSLKSRFEDASSGRLDVRTFLGATDGEISLARQCKDGALEGVGVSTGAIAEMVPQLGVFELPYLFSSIEEADRIIDQHLFEPVEALLRDNGYQLYIFSENGYRNFATTNGTIIRTPADLAGLTMRSQESWIHEEMYRALGGNPSPIPVGEVPTALQNGNVQGFDNTPLFAQAASWHRFVDAWTISNHIYQPAVVVYNRDWYDGLPQDLKALVLSNREQETRSGRRLIRALTPALVENLRRSGIEVVELSEEQKSALAEQTRPVHNMFRERVSGGGELLDVVYAHK